MAREEARDGEVLLAVERPRKNGTNDAEDDELHETDDQKRGNLRREANVGQSGDQKGPAHDVTRCQDQTARHIFLGERTRSEPGKKIQEESERTPVVLHALQELDSLRSRELGEPVIGRQEQWDICWLSPLDQEREAAGNTHRRIA